jgi:hypothetical protein
MATRVTGTKTVTRTGPSTISAPTTSISLDAPTVYITGGISITDVTTITNKLVLSTVTNTSLLANETVYFNIDQTANVTNPLNQLYTATNIYGTFTQRIVGAVYVPGGVGIEKDLNVGGFIYGRVAEANTSVSIIVTSTNENNTFYPLFSRTSSGIGEVYTDITGERNGLTYNPSTGKLIIDRIHVASTESSISPITGAFTVSGGVGILGDVNLGKNLTVNGDITPAQNLIHSIGTTSSQWYEGFLQNIYTNVIASTTGSIEIRPDAELTDIYGNIRVRGDKPLGTAPVVTNTLYVTVDGNDTNDGRAQDASRACRTIGGALNSPYYQPGTQILVSPGRYLENNPLRLKPYTSIRGSDIRTTFVEPINKTQDLFHLESGCYLNYMTFLNGRSGLLEGPYAAGYNRGAYCTAFPPLEGNERIDLFHSPYVQNCTNQSGPWLKDGSLYQPNQTVQIPEAVGTGTWVKNTTTLIVYVSTGTIKQGMSINSGQQNPGFFNARTLILANKSFLQEQVINYISNQITTNVGNSSSIWWNTLTNTSFSYNEEKCRRDVGILVENVAYDAAFGGNQKARESGLAYYNGVVSLIAGQEKQTTSAINYLNTLTQLVIVNATCPVIGSNIDPQIKNTALTKGNIASQSINNLFGIITKIINQGPSAAPDLYSSPGPDAAFVSAEILMQTNRKFIQEDTINYINKNLIGATFPYSEIKCRRDTGLIIDSIAFDMLYPTTNYSQSTFAGLQYWKQKDLVPTITDEITTTTLAISYLKELAGKVILNLTPNDDLIPRYQTVIAQNTTTYQAATSDEVNIIYERFDEILEILRGTTTGWTDRIVPNGKKSNFLAVANATYNLLTNTNYMAHEVTAYINYVTSGTGFVYNTSTCRRDIGYIVNAVAFDLLHSGNRQSVQNGLYYYGFSVTTSSVEAQQSQTVAAFNYLSSLTNKVIQNIPVVAKQDKVPQVFTSVTATNSQGTTLNSAIGIITGIITGTSTVALPPQTIGFTASSVVDVIEAFDNLYANKNFLIEEVITYIDQTYNPTAFNYDEAKCYRDVGLLIDAVSQDILLGGNQKSIEAGQAYWSAGYNYIAGQETTTTMAINYVSYLSTMTAANKVVTPQTNTDVTQVINSFFEYGWEYGPQEAIKRNYNIITDIIKNGPNYAPPVYAGGGLFALTGLNGSDVIISPKVTAVYTASGGTFLIGLNTSTVGFGINSTLYFGNTTVFPYTDKEVEDLSYELTGNTSTWNSRKTDPIGSMGGSLVDGGVISARSPIQSFVYDAFTQVNQGGRGVHITNDGYAQLVSVFTIFCSVGVQVDNGGIASIVNSNANFGDICLLAKGFGKRKFSGTIYNPSFKAFNRDTGARDPSFDQYFPDGFWPKAARVEVFVPDIDDRPHISLIMEIEPPEGHINEQLLPGFLNAIPNKAILNTGSIVISDIDTDGIAIGNSLYIRDINNNRNYVATGTVVTDIGYRSVVLNKALINGGGDVNNDNFFNLYFCGNAYYTVLGSTVAENPKTNGINLLSTSSTGLAHDQVQPHANAIRFLNSLTLRVISNQAITSLQTGTTYTPDPLVTGGAQASTFINLRFNEILSILTATNVTAAEAIIPERLRNKTGTAPLGASSAINLINRNIEFLADEVSAYTTSTYAGSIFSGISQATYNMIVEKCQRDVKLILRRIIYDLESGGRYNSVMTGLSYWSRNGTHFIVQMAENVRRTDLFPDGSTVNFYQRSYMSASGYVFEYVGAGTNYGSLPQVGRADPVQGKETVQLSGGKVFFTSTDQNGDFRIGPGLVISQATGVLSGRTFTKSLFANMTPFILAIEGGGI